MIRVPCCNPSICKRPYRNRTAACLRRGIADATSVSPEILCRHLRICLADTHRRPVPSQTKVNRAITGELRQRPQLWLARLPYDAVHCGKAQGHRLADARVSVREPGSTTQGQPARRLAATRNVQLAGATNAHPSRPPAFLPDLHFQFAAWSAVRFPNANRIPPWPPRLRANVSRPVSIYALVRLNPSQSLFGRRHQRSESVNPAGFPRLR